MKQLLSICLLLALASSAHALPTHYYGELSGSGSYSGHVDINSGWIDPPFGLNSWGEQVNVWGFTGKAGDHFSLDIHSDELVSGFSLYLGEVDSLDLLYGLFNNSGDIGDAKYLTGSSLWGSNQSLSTFLLNYTGFYTLIVGGKDFAGYEGYNYQLDITHASVPEPATLLLLLSGLVGALMARRRLQRSTK